jgi:hypothetical protein
MKWLEHLRIEFTSVQVTKCPPQSSIPLWESPVERGHPAPGWEALGFFFLSPVRSREENVQRIWGRDTTGSDHRRVSCEWGDVDGVLPGAPVQVFVIWREIVFTAISWCNLHLQNVPQAGMQDGKCEWGGVRVLLEERYLYSAMWPEDNGWHGVQPGVPD